MMTEKQNIKIGDTIAMIGLGRMGHGMAVNLLKAGFKLRGLAHPGNQPLDDLINAGAVICDDIASTLLEAKLVIICVTGTDDVEAVLSGAGGILEAATAPLMIMDCSTGIPADTRKRHEKALAQGHFLFDAAMTRTPAEAAEGRLNLIIGGDDSLKAQIDPVLTTIAEVVTIVGNNGAGAIGIGQEAKLIHNFVSLGFSAILAEAAARADESGMSRATFMELIGKGGGGGVVFDRFGPFLEEGRKDAFNFTIANAAKDLGYFDRAYFDRMGGKDSLNSAILALYDEANQGDEATVPELVDHIRRKLSQG